MRILLDTADSAPDPALLLILLAGTYSQPEDFVREGFPAAVRERAIPAEIAMAAPPASQVADGSVVSAVHEDLVGPARARGRRRLWLGGHFPRRARGTGLRRTPRD